MTSFTVRIYGSKISHLIDRRYLIFIQTVIQRQKNAIRRLSENIFLNKFTFAMTRIIIDHFSLSNSRSDQKIRAIKHLAMLWQAKCRLRHEQDQTIENDFPNVVNEENVSIS